MKICANFLEKFLAGLKVFYISFHESNGCSAFPNTQLILLTLFPNSLIPFPPIYGYPFVRSSRDKTTLSGEIQRIYWKKLIDMHVS